MGFYGGFGRWESDCRTATLSTLWLVFYPSPGPMLNRENPRSSLAIFHLDLFFNDNLSIRVMHHRFFFPITFLPWRNRMAAEEDAHLCLFQDDLPYV